MISTFHVLTTTDGRSRTSLSEAQAQRAVANTQSQASEFALRARDAALQANREIDMLRLATRHHELLTSNHVESPGSVASELRNEVREELRQSRDSMHEAAVTMTQHAW